MSVLNKLFLQNDGLQVGNNQLVVSGGNVLVGNNLAVNNTIFSSNIITSSLTVTTLETTNNVNSNNITITSNLTVNNTLYVSNSSVGIGLSPVAYNGILQLNSYASIKGMLEAVGGIGSSPSSTQNFDVITQSVLYFSSTSGTNFTLNIRGNSTTALNTIMQANQSCSVALLVTNGSSAYYPSTIQIDGTTVTPKWQGGSAPTGGNASATDVYAITIFKTASATFTVFISQSKFV
jgi:hypothetical protein